MDMEIRYDKAALDIRFIIEGTVLVYVTLITVIIWAILLPGVVVIVFVLYLLVRTICALLAGLSFVLCDNTTSYIFSQERFTA